MTPLLCVHSLTSWGNVGLRPFLREWGAHLLPVPSLLLSGPGNWPGCRRFPVELPGLLRATLAMARERQEPVRLFVGYLAHAEQVTAVKQAIDEFREVIREVVVDPVCGDAGRPYVSPALIAAWPSLLEQADLALPNATEVELLSGGQGTEAVHLLRQRFPNTTWVSTGWREGADVLTRVFTPEGQEYVHAQAWVEGPTEGAGDHFAAVWSAETFLRGRGMNEAVGLAAEAVAKRLRGEREPG